MRNVLKIGIIAAVLITVIIVGAVVAPLYFENTNSPTPTPPESATNSPSPTQTPSASTSPTSASTPNPTATVTNSPTASPSPTATPTPTNKTIIDMAGRNVTVPWTINRVAITTQGGAIQDVVLFAGADKIVGLSSSKGLDNLQKMCPDVNLAQTVYSSSINAETIIALNPDIVITSKSSTNKTTYQQIEAAGIPVVGIGCGSNNNIELIEKEFRMFGALFNCPEKAEALISFWDTQLAMIQQHEQSITSENKVRAYYVLGSITHTNGKSAWGQALMDSAGVINVAYDLTVSDTDVEQLIKWNPDLMFLSSNEGKFVSISEVMTSPQLQDISAVKNTRVYLSPVGTFWWDRPSPEAILGITWLAKTAYPAQFADVDLFSISSNFYQTFYNYTLTPSDYQGFLAPTS